MIWGGVNIIYLLKWGLGVLPQNKCYVILIQNCVFSAILISKCVWIPWADLEIFEKGGGGVAAIWSGKGGCSPKNDLFPVKFSDQGGGVSAISATLPLNLLIDTISQQEGRLPVPIDI